ncbi:hypothetical protein ATPR_1344 [Acetobacter tropicalis NBRC 101654]|uniref:Uncharacterized protein n=1 Tax=Acetobacter tropicalis NBRC 101654 TaxID=749388 RepID=F7VD95_9PROT|nr:hypothetical protein ATPR_1344 [Acetobacter tropicalis NBRC 101654]
MFLKTTSPDTFRDTLKNRLLHLELQPFITKTPKNAKNTFGFQE